MIRRDLAACLICTVLVFFMVDLMLEHWLDLVLVLSFLDKNINRLDNIPYI